MNTSDLIAVAAILVSFLSAYYARQSRDANRKANEIAARGQLRPARLATFQSMTSFAHYCSTYVTLYHLKAVKGSRDLVARIETFKWEVDQRGELGMVDVAAKVKELINHAWQMQRLLDRISGGQNSPLDPAYDTADDNLAGLIEWFADQTGHLKDLFGPYLTAA